MQDPAVNSINVRQLKAAVLAVLHWGPVSSQIHPLTQLYNRLLSLAEFQYSLLCTAKHIAGELNVMTDDKCECKRHSKITPGFGIGAPELRSRSAFRYRVSRTLGAVVPLL
ncbi:hypothetical protein PR003_g2907 [Phytophthora rubi]|uniref:Uncharacterized protein n=1 Tax=Phytophthora rubi TaxID=129364 RepID=A0A6A4G763_9STRA|nr:hypothetical protein PR002_g1395 [Phytophthora rubi]KAE9050030.1 hypothetical protein PR001_g2764 [Phytophthora rubi]KAE9355297.1 hypothetical protein PR003_g2907 [Phytophthora rubi]